MFTTTYVTATGDVGSTGSGSLLFVLLTAGSDAATLTLRQGGSGGSIIMVVKAPTGESVPVPIPGGANYTGQLHATLAGTGPVATITTGS